MDDRQTGDCIYPDAAHEMNPLYNLGLFALQIGNDDRSRGIAIQLVCSQINLIMLILGTGNQLAFCTDDQSQPERPGAELSI